MLPGLGHIIEAKCTPLLGVLINELYKVFLSDDPQTPFSKQSASWTLPDLQAGSWREAGVQGGAAQVSKGEDVDKACGGNWEGAGTPARALVATP